jgi:hypothetical protein
VVVNIALYPLLNGVLAIAQGILGRPGRTKNGGASPDLHK